MDVLCIIAPVTCSILYLRSDSNSLLFFSFFLFFFLFGEKPLRDHVDIVGKDELGQKLIGWLNTKF